MLRVTTTVSLRFWNRPRSIGKLCSHCGWNSPKQPLIGSTHPSPHSASAMPARGSCGPTRGRRLPRAPLAGPRPPPIPLHPHHRPHLRGDSSQAECRLLAERLAAINGRGFSGPPHYFDDNNDPERKKKNHDEFSRRRSGGLCFKCTQAEVTSCPFLECPRHGAEAVRSGAASGAAAVRRHGQA